MTHVKWHPVEVDKQGRILEGKEPKDDSYVYISIDNSAVELIHFEDGIFGEGRIHDWYKRINAWAKIKMPKPYKPEEPLDNHPDAITARKYMEGDPETVKALHIFDE